MVASRASQAWAPIIDELSAPPEAAFPASDSPASGIRLTPSARKIAARKRLVHEVMTWPAHRVSPLLSVAHALVFVERLGLDHLPVVSFAELVGVVCASDLREAPSDALVHDLMSHDPVVIHAGTTLLDAAAELEETAGGCLVVPWNGSFGTVTRADLARAGLPLGDGEPSYYRDVGGQE